MNMNRMKPFVIAVLAAVLVGSVQGQNGETTSSSAKKAGPVRPKNFPDVKLAEGSNPRYCQVKLNSLSEQVAYILFDGNLANGYRGMYIWSPGHEEYDEPQYKLRDDQTGNYRPFKGEHIAGDVASITTWTIRYRTATQGGSYVDYATGKTITRKRRRVARFYFNVDLRQGPARRSDREAGKYPVDIGMSGYLPASDSWEDMPAILAPWENTYCSMSRQPVYDKGEGYLRCKAHLRFHRYRGHRGGGSRVTIRNLPENAKVHMEIAPYLGETIYERNFTMEEIFMNHYDVRIPYGWYRMDWAFESDFFGAQSIGHNSDNRPFAFSPPPPN